MNQNTHIINKPNTLVAKTSPFPSNEISSSHGSYPRSWSTPKCGTNVGHIVDKQDSTNLERQRNFSKRYSTNSSWNASAWARVPLPHRADTHTTVRHTSRRWKTLHTLPHPSRVTMKTLYDTHRRDIEHWTDNNSCRQCHHSSHSSRQDAPTFSAKTNYVERLESVQRNHLTEIMCLCSSTKANVNKFPKRRQPSTMCSQWVMTRKTHLMKTTSEITSQAMNTIYDTLKSSSHNRTRTSRSSNDAEWKHDFCVKDLELNSGHLTIQPLQTSTTFTVCTSISRYLLIVWSSVQLNIFLLCTQIVHLVNIQNKRCNNLQLWFSDFPYN